MMRVLAIVAAVVVHPVPMTILHGGPENFVARMSDGDEVVVVAESPSPDKAHLSANDFEREVAKVLAKRFPSRVEEPQVIFFQYRQKGRSVYHFAWSATIIPTDQAHADSHFARRGTLMCARTLSEAEHAAQFEFGKSGKLGQLEDLFPRGRLPQSFWQHWSEGSPRKGYCYLVEQFIAAPK